MSRIVTPRPVGPANGTSPWACAAHVPISVPVTAVVGIARFAPISIAPAESRELAEHGPGASIG